MSLSIQRAVSIVLAAGYVIASLIVYQPLSLRAEIDMFVLKFLLILLPVVCIWFGDDWRDYLSAFPRITRDTPAGWVRIAGWCLLALYFVVLFTLEY